MDRVKPPYLNEIPRDRRGNWPMYLLAVALLAALVGGWAIYARTVAAWSDRFQPTTKPAASGHDDERARQRQMALIRLRRERAEAQRERQRQLESGELRCIGGTLLRKLPDGWENVPGERC